MATQGTAQQAAARSARPSSGPAVTIRSASCAASAIAGPNSTGWLSCRASSAARSSPGPTGRPVTVEISRRRGGAKRVPAKTLRSGASHLAIAGECSACVMPSTSTGTPAAAARRARLRMPAVDPASTCERAPS